MKRLGLLLALALLQPALLGLTRPRGLGDVADVRHWSYGGYTRVVVELSRAVRTEVKRLPADSRAGRPERLYLDLGGVWIGKRYSEPIPVSDGLLQSVRLGQNTKTSTRLVIDLERYDRHRLLVLTSPHRVVVDIYGDVQTRSVPKSGLGSDSRLSSDLRPIRRVVVDAGHGGRDPGAIGVGGLREKVVTLQLARALQRRLEAREFDVVMTRSRDQTLSLEERTALAEGVDGDLFVSLHANASPRRSTRGIETYYLDKSHERHTLRVASHENGVAPAQLDPLQRTLATLKVDHNSAQSANLAVSVHKQLLRGVRGRYGKVRDLGVKQGPFYVLFLSSMPSILVETGFLTNRDDAKLLKSSAYLDLVADHIAAGITRYRDAHTVVVAGTGR